MKLAVEAGRLAYRAGRIPRRAYASASSPLDGHHSGARRRGARWPGALDAPCRSDDGALDETLRRLKQERDDADRRYNDALTALDRALPGAAPDRAPAAGWTTRSSAPLNEAWKIVPAAPAGGAGWRGRLDRLHLANRRRRTSSGSSRSTRSWSIT